jgi:hypothetical protein
MHKVRDSVKRYVSYETQTNNIWCPATSHPSKNKHNLHSARKIIMAIKLWGMKRVGNAARMGDILNAYKDLRENPKEEGHF